MRRGDRYVFQWRRMNLQHHLMLLHQLEAMASPAPQSLPPPSPAPKSASVMTPESYQLELRQEELQHRDFSSREWGTSWKKCCLKSSLSKKIYQLWHRICLTWDLILQKQVFSWNVLEYSDKEIQSPPSKVEDTFLSWKSPESDWLGFACPAHPTLSRRSWRLALPNWWTLTALPWKAICS